MVLALLFTFNKNVNNRFLQRKTIKNKSKLLKIIRRAATNPLKDNMSEGRLTQPHQPNNLSVVWPPRYVAMPHLYNW